VREALTTLRCDPTTLQYENLTSDANMAPALRDLKSFLEIDPLLPSDDLGLKNFRHQRGGEHVRAACLQCQGQGVLPEPLRMLPAVALPAHNRLTGVSCLPLALRGCCLQSDGWPMSRSQYESLVEKARRNAEE
jgi:hypothetical protein